MSDKPSIFIGSSKEGLSIAEAIQMNLDYDCEATIWSQGVFGLAGGTLETLVEKAFDFDFAVLVLTPDDMVISRDSSKSSPRDNVILELGLFLGSLGRKRTFVVYDRDANVKLPSDMAGITLADYAKHGSGNIQSSVGSACTKIKQAIKDQGRRPKPKVAFDIDQDTQFQIITDLLDESIRQFFILMHDNNTHLLRSSFHGRWIEYDWSKVKNGRAGGTGSLNVDEMCKKLADSGLLSQNLKNQVSLTTRGHEYAKWLIQKGYKADYFKCELGNWGLENMSLAAELLAPMKNAMQATPEHK